MDTTLYTKFKKQTIRTQVKKHVKACVRTLDAKKYAHLQYTQTRALISRVLRLPEWKYAQFVVGYTPIQYECDVTALLALAQQNHKEAMIPLPDKYPTTLRTWKTNHDTQYYMSNTGAISRIPVPRVSCNRSNTRFNGSPEIPLEKLASTTDMGIVLVPGLAFTLSGNRLGRGGGYYDRLLTRLQENPHVFSIGVCLTQQLVPEYYLPHTTQDKRVDLVLPL